MNAIEKYYTDQAGGGSFDYYIGSQNQRGHGIGSLFAGLLRTAIPILKPLLKRGLKSGAKALGRHVLKKASDHLAKPSSSQPRKTKRIIRRKRVISRKGHHTTHRKAYRGLI